MTNPNDPAFAHDGALYAINKSIDIDPELRGKVTAFEQYFCGLSKREYFAGKAMQGMMSLNPPDMLRFANPNNEKGTVGEWVAMNCVQMADFLIAELSKAPK